jgi:hypothetical protein
MKRKYLIFQYKLTKCCLYFVLIVAGNTDKKIDSVVAVVMQEFDIFQVYMSISLIFLKFIKLNYLNYEIK